MGEPVGNSPRNQTFPGNSLKARETVAQEQPQPAPKEREAPEKIVKGKITLRKTPWWKRAVGKIVADDASSMGEYLIDGVLIPTIRNLIRTAVVETTDQVLFGGPRNPRVGVGIAQTLGRTVVNGTSLRTQYRDVPAERRVMTAEAQSRHDFADVTLDDRQEAIDVVNSLIADLQEYGVVTVSDLYGYLGVPSSHADRKWGWYDLSNADIRQTSSGFKLDLPRPTPLR